MANKKNLTHKLTAEELRKGGKNSGKSRREKKTVQKILNDIMESDVAKYPAIAAVAKKMGIESEKNVKDLFTLVATLNALKTANLDDLKSLINLLGEEAEGENKGALADILAAVRGLDND